MPRWTPESRLKQAQRIRSWSPWEKSTGPRTAEGKKRSRANAWKGGHRFQVRHYTEIVRLIERTHAAVARHARVNSSFWRKPVSHFHEPGGDLKTEVFSNKARPTAYCPSNSLS